MSCDPSTLVAQAACIECGIPPGLQMPVLIYLFCQILANGTGGGGSGNPPPGIVNPNGTVTGAPDATYYNTANATFWVQASSTTGNTGWVQLI